MTVAQTRVFKTEVPASTLLIRLVIGSLAAMGGSVQQFRFPQMRDDDRFAEIDVLAPGTIATWGGIVAIVAGMVIVLGESPRS